MRKWFLSLAVMLIVTFACAPDAPATPTVIITGDMEVCWTAPIENVDGSLLTDLAGFWIYFATASDGHSNAKGYDILDETQTCQFLDGVFGMTDADVYIKMTAYDDAGNESAWSNEAMRTVGNTGEIPGSATGVITKP